MSEIGILPQPIPFGKYYLLERVNVGGMAEIFKAKAFGVEGFERLLAVKRILATIAEDESFINMFIDEAKIAGQLNHPNIVQAIDQVAAKLGNTRSVCKKYYVHPAILQAYEDQTLWQYAERNNPGENARLNLSPDEKAVYDIINNYELSSGFSETLHKNQGTTTAVP